MTTTLDQRNESIKASAGSGKTFQLSKRYLRLLFQNTNPSEILATTFTRKAAREILERILARLIDAIKSPEAAQRLIDDLGMETNNALADCQKAFWLLIKNLHNIQICTLDSYCSKLATCYSLELGLPYDWRIVESQRELELRLRALLDVANEDRARTETMLNLLAAGETSRSVVQQLLNETGTLANVWSECLPGAWQQIKPIKPYPDSELYEIERELTEYHAFCNGKLIKNAIEDLLKDLQKRDWDDALQGKLLRNQLSDEQRGKFGASKLDDELMAILDRLLDYIRPEIHNQIANRNRGTELLLSSFDEKLAAVMRAERSFSFHDITLAVARAMSSDFANWQTRTDARIEHLLLDEVQDTSALQLQVLKPLIERVSTNVEEGMFATNAASNSFFSVGDPKQSIYGWRGGLPEVFDEIEHLVPELQKPTLAKSFRSSPVIIDFVNQFFGALARTDEKGKNAFDLFKAGRDAWLQDFEPHSTEKSGMPGYVAIETYPASDEEETDPETGETVRLGEIDYAARYIADLANRAPDKTIGVLLRSNKPMAELLAQLKSLGIPASSEGRSTIADDPVVSALLALLWLVDHPSDSAALYHVTHRPLEVLLELPFPCEPHLLEQKVATLRREIADFGFAKVMERWLNKLRPMLTAQELERVNVLEQVAHEMDVEQEVSVTRFVQYVRSVQISLPTPDRIRLMTIHSSKGLEFDIVVLPELNGNMIGQRPQYASKRVNKIGPIEIASRWANKNIRPILDRRIEDMFDEYENRQVRESISLLYVAFTRAIHDLRILLTPQKQKASEPVGVSYTRVIRKTLELSLTEPKTNCFHIGNPDWVFLADQASSEPTSSTVMPSEDPPPSDQAQLSEESSSSAGVPVNQITFKPAPRLRFLDQMNPSRLSRERKINLAERLLLVDPARVAARERGNIIHYMLRKIRWLTQNDRIWESFRLKCLPGPYTEQQLIAHWPHFAHLLSCEPMMRSMQPEIYGLAHSDAEQDVWLERPFAIRIGEQLVRGVFDRVVITTKLGVPIHAEIIDFKSNLPSRTNHEPENDADAMPSLALDGFVEELARQTNQQAILSTFDPQHVMASETSAFTSPRKMTHRWQIINHRAGDNQGELASLRELVSQHEPQMLLYRRSLARMLELPEKQISLRLLYTGFLAEAYLPS